MTEKAAKIASKIQAVLSNYYSRVHAYAKMPANPEDYPENEGVLLGRAVWGPQEELGLATASYASAVAEKLDATIPTHPDEWLSAVGDSMVSIPLKWRGHDLHIGKVEGLAETVAQATGVLVAPKGSAWFRGLEAFVIAKVSVERPSKTKLNDILERWRRGRTVMIKVHDRQGVVETIVL